MLPLKKSLPIVSVIVPVYNAESTIEECIDSLLMLKYPKENSARGFRISLYILLFSILEKRWERYSDLYDSYILIYEKTWPEETVQLRGRYLFHHLHKN